MTEQTAVTVQELQRLNDSITLALDAIRRVAPQIALLQQQVAQYSPFINGYQHPLNTMGLGNPMGQHPAWGTPVGIPFGNPFVGGPNTPFTSPYATPFTSPYGVPYTTPFTSSYPGVYGNTPTGVDPMTAAYLQGHVQALRTVLAQTQGPVGGHIGQNHPNPVSSTWQNPVWQGGMGQVPFTNRPF